MKVIRKVVEELWASKSSGYKKVQLGTKKSVSLQDGLWDGVQGYIHLSTFRLPLAVSNVRPEGMNDDFEV